MPKRVLILGGTGMLGHVLFLHFSSISNFDVYATARSFKNLDNWFPQKLVEKIRPIVDADNFDTIIRAFAAIQPEIVINCIGLIKQLPVSRDPLSSITINSSLPHRISMLCRAAHARLIHISTDCVFDGKKGNYAETDAVNPDDLYGRSKLLGEVAYPPHCITIRTSMIGHELKGKRGLIEWFLAQENKIQGFSKVIYSGFPTIELSHIIADHIIPNTDLTGIYHVSSNPVSKYDLLKLVAEKYNKTIEIEPYDSFVQDRSLDSAVFRKLSGYSPPDWHELIDKMHEHYISSSFYNTPENKG